LVATAASYTDAKLNPLLIERHVVLVSRPAREYNGGHQSCFSCSEKDGMSDIGKLVFKITGPEEYIRVDDLGRLLWAVNRLYELFAALSVSQGVLFHEGALAPLPDDAVLRIQEIRSGSDIWTNLFGLGKILKPVRDLLIFLLMFRQKLAQEKEKTKREQEKTAQEAIRTALKRLEFMEEFWHFFQKLSPEDQESFERWVGKAGALIALNRNDVVLKD